MSEDTVFACVSAIFWAFVKQIASETTNYASKYASTASKWPSKVMYIIPTV